MNERKAGAVLSYASLLVTLLVALVYTPIMIRLIGQSEYGLFALIGSLAAYFSVMDLGLGNTIIRYISRNNAIGSKEIESKLNGFFLKIYSCIGLLAIVIGLLVWLNVDIIFGNSLTESELDKAKIMIIILIFNFALSFPLSIFSSILQAYEKFIVVKTTSIIRALLIPTITLPFLFIGYGAVLMLFITTIVNIFVLIFQAIYAFKKLNVEFNFNKIESSFVKEIVGFSIFIFLNVLVDLIYWNTDQFLLGVISGTQTIAIYAIAMQFVTIYKMFSTSLSNLFLPQASKLVANNASNQIISELMVRYGRIQFIILTFILSGFFLFGNQFIYVWAGASYTDAFYIVLIIMIPLLIPLTQNFGIAVLQAKNEQRFRVITYLIIAIINVIISIPLAIYYGGIGIAFATAVSLILGHIIIMNIYYHKVIKIDMILYWKNVSSILLVVIIITTFGYVINNYLFNTDDLLSLAIKIVIYILIFTVSIWLFGMNKYEKELVKNTKLKIAKKFNFSR
ncbi:oligosaccharide flippase family protein [Alkalihalobacillus sp. NPDC078783]